MVVGRANIGMANEGHILNVLNAHYSHQLAAFFISPEYDSPVHFMAEFAFRHGRVFPAVRRNYSFIRPGSVVYNLADHFKFTACAWPNHGSSPFLRQKKR